ncbi:hypothetical protein [Novacetimonas hansenii]|uniref:hypothetical protein n=1 Tax=Novacetimonas hansenii TaxID=436 RepID=UPI0011152D82|nr:hypothetical protein [Novacetimonas hansenii]
MLPSYKEATPVTALKFSFQWVIQPVHPGRTQKTMIRMTDVFAEKAVPTRRTEHVGSVTPPKPQRFLQKIPKKNLCEIIAFSEC